MGPAADLPTKVGIRVAPHERMNRILAAALVAIAATTTVACASSEPEQQDGLTLHQKKMSEAEAQKLLSDMEQAGPVCRRAVSDCSYSAPDADGMVVFEALVSCTSGGACPLLQAESGCTGL